MQCNYVQRGGFVYSYLKVQRLLIIWSVLSTNYPPLCHNSVLGIILCQQWKYTVQISLIWLSAVRNRVSWKPLRTGSNFRICFSIPMKAMPSVIEFNDAMTKYKTISAASLCHYSNLHSQTEFQKQTKIFIWWQWFLHHFNQTNMTVPSVYIIV